jgi:hypothetical protein
MEGPRSSDNKADADADTDAEFTISEAEMIGVYFTCGQCKESIAAGGGWAVEQLVVPRIIAAADEGKPINVKAVLARREYLDQLPAVEEFLQEHREHTVRFESVDGTPAARENRDRPAYYRPVPMDGGRVLIRAGGKFVRSDFIIARHPVTVREFQEIVGLETEDSKDISTLKLATRAGAIRYCNLLSQKEGRPPAYDEAGGVLLDGAGNPARGIAGVKGFRLPTGSEWGYAAYGGRPDPPYADWGAVLDRIYWDDPTSHYAKPVAPKEPVVNAVGLVGMMGLVREWTIGLLPAGACRTLVCGWSTYETNYDCNLAYYVAGEVAAEGARVPFRIAMSGESVP